MVSINEQLCSVAAACYMEKSERVVGICVHWEVVCVLLRKRQGWLLKCQASKNCNLPVLWSFGAFSALTLFVGTRKSIWPVKNESVEVLAWLSVWSDVQMICIWSSWCHCHPIISCFIKIQISLTFLMLAYSGCRGKEAIKRVSVRLWSFAMCKMCKVCYRWVHFCLPLHLNSDCAMCETLVTIRNWWVTACVCDESKQSSDPQSVWGDANTGPFWQPQVRNVPSLLFVTLLMLTIIQNSSSKSVFRSSLTSLW